MDKENQITPKDIDTLMNYYLGSFMGRNGIPSGDISPEQLSLWNDLCEKLSNLLNQICVQNTKK
jgi:hypothetical protein